VEKTGDRDTDAGKNLYGFFVLGNSCVTGIESAE
jgi:hypothetical protein